MTDEFEARLFRVMSSNSEHVDRNINAIYALIEEIRALTWELRVNINALRSPMLKDDEHHS